MTDTERHEWVRERWADILDAAQNVSALAKSMGYNRSTLYRFADGNLPVPASLARDYLRATGDDQGFASLTGAADCHRVVAKMPETDSETELSRAAYNVRAAITLLDQVSTEAIEINAAIDAAQRALSSNRAAVRLVAEQ